MSGMIASMSIHFKMRRYFLRHGHIFSFLGAVIVFATFIMREGLQEHWKHTAETIDEAERSYTDDSRFIELKADLESLLTRTSPNVPALNKWRKAHSINVRASILSRNVEPLFNDVQMLMKLAETLPGDDNIQGKVNNLRDDASTFKKLIDDINLRIESGTSKTDLENKISRGEEMTRSMDFNFHAVHKVILEDSDQIERRNELFADCAWWISAFLFAFGWGLGFLGKFYGVPEAAGGG